MIKPRERQLGPGSWWASPTAAGRYRQIPPPDEWYVAADDEIHPYLDGWTIRPAWWQR